MRILIATPLVPPEIGGPAIYTQELVHRIAAKHTVTVVAYASTSEPMPSVRFLTASKDRPLPIRLVKFFLLLYRAAADADVIYVQNAVAAGLPAMLVGKLRRIPVVLKFVGDEAWERATQRRETSLKLEDFLQRPEGGWYVRTLSFIQGVVLRNVDLVTTPSAYLRDAIVGAYGINPAKAHVNYNAAEETEAPPIAPDPHPHRVVATARLVAWKGIDGIIRAIGILASRIPDIELTIAGDGPELERCQTLTKELGLTDRVTFLGRVSRAETWHLRKSAGVYVLNSTYEGLPHTAITSFAAGIPMVATDIPGTNEAVFHEDSGLLVPAGDDQALAAAIERLMTDRALAERVVAGATRILAERFSWEAHLATLFGFFDSLVAIPGNKGRNAISE